MTSKIVVAFHLYLHLTGLDLATLRSHRTARIALHPPRILDLVRLTLPPGTETILILHSLALGRPQQITLPKTISSSVSFFI